MTYSRKKSLQPFLVSNHFFVLEEWIKLENRSEKYKTITKQSNQQSDCKFIFLSNSKVTKKLFIFSTFQHMIWPMKQVRRKKKWLGYIEKQGKNIRNKFQISFSFIFVNEKIQSGKIQYIKYTANAKVPEENSSVFASSIKN